MAYFYLVIENRKGNIYYLFLSESIYTYYHMKYTPLNQKTSSHGYIPGLFSCEDLKFILYALELRFGSSNAQWKFCPDGLSKSNISHDA